MKRSNLFTNAILSMAMAMVLVSCSGEDGMDGDPGLPGTDGISCWDLNANGQGDPGEDINGDNNFNGLDCQGDDGDDGKNGISCWDTDGDGIADAEEDINDDGNFDGLDCQGSDGEDGDVGDDGISCWDLNGNGSGDIDENDPDNDEDINNDGVVNALDCQGDDGEDGEDGNANVQKFDFLITDFTGSELDIDLNLTEEEMANKIFLFYIKLSGFSALWYPVPGALDMNATYTRVLFSEKFGTVDVFFYNTSDNSPYIVSPGEYTIFRVVAIDFSLGSKGSQKSVLEQLKAAGVDTNDYASVANYFGLDH